MKHTQPALFAILILLAGCQGPPERATQTPSPTVTPTPTTMPAPGVTGTLYDIDSGQSWLRVLVYKSGRLARFGHNHVITSSSLSGQVFLDGPEPVIGLTMPLSTLVVDDPSARAAEGEAFPGDIPQKDRDGTRANMLGEALLNAVTFPTLEITSIAVRGSDPNYTVDAKVNLAGQSSTIQFPVTVERDGATLVATGRTQVLHEQLGLTPFSALLGALTVREDIGLHYHFVANRVDET